MTDFGILPFTSLRVLVAGLAADRQPFWVFKQPRLVCRQLRVAVDSLLVEKDIGGLSSIVCATQSGRTTSRAGARPGSRSTLACATSWSLYGRYVRGSPGGPEL
jgi:hypothetical protein